MRGNVRMIQRGNVVLTTQQQIDMNVQVSILKYENGTYECGVLTNWFPRLYPDRWELDESLVPVRQDLSSMQVYGFIEHEVKPAYLGGSQ